MKNYRLNQFADTLRSVRVRFSTMIPESCRKSRHPAQAFGEVANNVHPFLWFGHHRKLWKGLSVSLYASVFPKSVKVDCVNITGLVFLQYRTETKRALLPNEITSIDTVRALFVRSFPRQLTMAYLEGPNVKIYIHDASKDMFYELEDVR